MITVANQILHLNHLPEYTNERSASMMKKMKIIIRMKWLLSLVLIGKSRVKVSVYTNSTHLIDLFK